ncbi:MAG: hypothetical protein HYT72_00795 [Candidatus Aenigmarchaeota archaeon]|nr:hypothetical protein [Candidatus Aenigmarchaeota archaeon]
MVYTPAGRNKQQQALDYSSKFQTLPKFQERMNHTLGLLRSFYVPEEEVISFHDYLIRECRNLITRSIFEVPYIDKSYAGGMDATQVFIEVGQLEAGEARLPFTPIQRAYLAVWARAVSEKLSDIANRYNMPELSPAFERFLQGVLNPPQAPAKPKLTERLIGMFSAKLASYAIPEQGITRYTGMFQLYLGKLKEMRPQAEVSALEDMSPEELQALGTETGRWFLDAALYGDTQLTERARQEFLAKKEAPKQEDPRSPFQKQMDDLFGAR